MSDLPAKPATAAAPPVEDSATAAEGLAPVRQSGQLCRFVIEIEGRHADALSDALLAAGALAVGVDDAQAGSDQEQAVYGEPGSAPEGVPWSLTKMEVLCPADRDPQRVLHAACEHCGLAVPALESPVAVADEDWVRRTQAQFPPTRISERLWVVPSWHEAPDSKAVNLRIDPGAAFGTGTHPTTRLCLQWLDQSPLVGCRVLDYGCGSGILAIAAAQLGAGLVIGTDIDPQALVVSRANARMNHATVRFLAPDAVATEAGAQGFDVVVANILAMPLIVLAPMLSARLRPGGWLVLSGILAAQGEAVAAAYLREGRIALHSWRADEGWVCLAGQAPHQTH